MRFLILVVILFTLFDLNAQFHSLEIPSASPAAQLGVQVGVTYIDIQYHSPSTRGRDVWNNNDIIPQNGKPILWRAGANENTTIEFDTDVFIEGQLLAAGKYGLHIQPNDHEHTLIFTKRNNLWGSYYVDINRDVALRVTVKDTLAEVFNEHLIYAFKNRKSQEITLTLHWAERLIPFRVVVDLNKTCVAKFRHDLNGENTYRWQAWNDAARWCLDNNTNLEEALIWVNRSIQGGFGGFGADKNFQNLSTKVELLDKLQKTEDLKKCVDEIFELPFTADEGHYMGATFLKLGKDQATIKLMDKGLSVHKNDFGLLLYKAVAYYYLNEPNKALKTLDKCIEYCPSTFLPRLTEIREEITQQHYEFPNRKS